MEKRVCNIGDLPLDTIENILSYVSDGDLVSLRTSETFQDAIQYMIRRRKKFKFSECHNVNEAQLMEFLKDVHVQHRVTHLNFDHCYWLNYNTFSAAVNLNNLQELHVIDCRISSEVVVVILGLRLTSLSLSWSWNWLNNLKSTHQGIILGTSPLPPLFTSLTHLVIFVPGRFVGPDTARSDFLVDVSTTFLRYCKGLISLKMYEFTEEGRPVKHNRSRRTVRFPRSHLLPLLESLTLDLPSEEELFIAFLVRIYGSRLKTPLKEANFGNATLACLQVTLRYLNPSNCHKPLNIDSLISAELISTLCLDVPRISNERKGLLMWTNNTTPNCTVVSLNGICPEDKWVLKTVASKCPKLESLTLHGSEMWIDDFEVGLKKIARLCPQVTALILTVKLHSNIFYCTFVLKTVGKFHALKILHITPSFFAKDRETYQHAPGRSLYEILDQPNNEMILEKAMKCWTLYNLTQNCKGVEEFKLCPPPGDEKMTDLPELMLACISKWKKLRCLHLYGVVSEEVGLQYRYCGYYISLITKSCRQLTTLGVTEDLNDIDQRQLNLALENAQSLKDLCIHRSLKWSVEVCNAMKLCSNLERLYISKILISAQDVPGFQDLLFVLPKLFVVIAKHCSVEQNIDMYFETEARFIRLQELRPAFIYKWGNSSNYSSDNFPVIHKDLLGRSFTPAKFHYDF